MRSAIRRSSAVVSASPLPSFNKAALIATIESEKQHTFALRESFTREREAFTREREAFSRERVASTRERDTLEEYLDSKKKEVSTLKCQLMLEKGTLSRRALYELYLQSLWRSFYPDKKVGEGQIQTKPPKFNATQCEQKLWKVAKDETCHASLSAELKAFVDCWKSNKEPAPMYGKLSLAIHGTGLDLPALLTFPGDNVMSREQHDFLLCLARAQFDLDLCPASTVN